jgi:hypothetical protein
MTDQLINAPQAPQPSERRFGNGVARISLSGGNSTINTNAGVVNETTATPRGGNSTPAPETSAPVTARSTWGSVLTGSQIKGDSIVKIGNMETSVAGALAAGLIRQNGDGSYVYASDARPTQEHLDILQKTGDKANFDKRFGDGAADKALGEQSAEAAKVADLDPQTHAIAAELSSVSNTTFTSAMASAIKGEDVSEHDVGQIAGQLQIEPDAVRSKVATVRAAFEDQARAMVGPMAQEIFDYAYAHEPALMTQAIKDHVQNERHDAYDAVTQRFWETLDRRDPDAIFTAQNAQVLQPRREGGGVISVMIPGVGRTSWGAAVRGGFIGSSKRK